jgi:CheY-like chemotaxis protein
VISRSFVKLMGGNLTVSSQLGKGTTFKFDINAMPVDISQIESDRPQRQIRQLEPGQGYYRLLVVDDKVFNRKLLTELLSPLGFEVKEATNGQEAIEIWQSWQPHLIWMDMRMPVIDGYTATQHIKATKKGKSTVIVAVTASVLESEKAEVFAAGCDDFLCKPFREEKVLEIMQRHLKIRYLYEDVTTDREPAANNLPANILSRDNLMNLPASIQQELQECLLTGNLALLATILDQIRSENSPLATAIQECCDRFQYEKILNLLSP